jgi:hypothetical protein
MRSEKEIRDALTMLEHDHHGYHKSGHDCKICGEIQALIWILEEGLLDN